MQNEKNNGVRFQMIEVTFVGNGFMLTRNRETDTGSAFEIITEKEMVVEGKDPKRIGLAVLSMFSVPRNRRKKPSAAKEGQ